MPARERASKGNLRILLITTEYPSADRPGGAAYLIRHIEALRSKGHIVEVLPFVSRANPLNHAKAWLEMRRRLKQSSFDLIHAHFGHSALIASLQRTVPLVITYHGSDLIGICDARGRYTLKGKIGSAISRILSLRAEAVIVVARHLGERLPRRDWTIVPLGVDFDRFILQDKRQARRQLGWSDDMFIVLFVALNINNPVKRFGLAKTAVDSLNKQLCAELKVAEGVPPERMPLYLCGADALLLTSVHEGSPTVVKEALACNLPVVTTDVGDVRERLEGVEPSFICDADPEVLGAALRALAMAGAVRSNGRSKISFLTESLVADRVLDVYRTVLARQSGLADQARSMA